MTVSKAHPPVTLQRFQDSAMLESALSLCDRIGSLSKRCFTVSSIDSRLLCTGFHPLDFNLRISRNMFFTSPTHPLPSQEPPVNLNVTVFKPIVSMIVVATSLTDIWSSEPTLKTSTGAFAALTEVCIASTQSSM